ncbi:MAG: fatty acid desaturase [Candidatus Staskawiczbacteria bacterium]|nr:fatty acid desaturase [Candidatus Staskawiczbacteria bacterium]
MLLKKKFSFKDLNVSVVIGTISMHLLAVFAFYYVTFGSILIFIFLGWLTGWVGIGVCYHRLLTHSSFKTPKWFMYLLATIGSLAWQGGPIIWVGNHRLHHQHADTDKDPHTPKHGFTWAHMFWLFLKNAVGKDPRDAAKDLTKDKGICFINKFFLAPQIFLAIFLFAFGLWYENLYTAIAWTIWGIGVRTVVVYHVTWFVNSTSHTWGYRSFDTNDTSTNCWWVAYLSGGEGWHNNHHAHQRCAAHGRKWWEFDPVFRTIQILSFFGLAYDIISAPDSPDHK